MMRLADLIAQFEPELLQRYAHRLLPSHRQALASLRTCRTRFAPPHARGLRELPQPALPATLLRPPRLPALPTL